MSSEKVRKGELGDLSLDDHDFLQVNSGLVEGLSDDEILAEGLSDDEIQFTSSADVNSVKAYDNTVEIVGYIDGIEASKIVGIKNNKIFKFFVNNNSGERIQVTCWNTECDRIEPLLRTNFIAHIDGAYAKPSLISNFNRGTVNYELIIQSNTMVNILGKHTLHKSNIQSELILLPDVIKHKNLISTQGYIKSNFYVMTNQNSKNGDFGCGSITDGTYKLEVRISDTNIDHLFTKGDHVEVTGYIQSNANPVYLLIQSTKDIKLTDCERMSIDKLLRGNKSLEKLPSDNPTPAKRAKSNQF